MNIYRIQEDNQSGLWQAETMHAAVKLAEDKFLTENTTGYDTEQQCRADYYDSILESCALVGELVNP